MGRIKAWLAAEAGGKLAAGSLLLVLFALFAVRNGWWIQPFWDNGVYARAVAEHLAGGEAYRVEPFPFFPFVYHPFVLQLLVWLQGAVPLAPALLALQWGGAIWAGAEAWRLSRLTAKGFGTALVVAGCFGMFGLTTFASGNLVGTFAFLIIACALRGLRRRGRVFGPAVFVLIVLGAVVKPYLLAYLGLVLLDRRDWPGAIGWMGLGAALAAGIWGAGFWVMPDLMARYLANIADLQSPGRWDLGFTIYGLSRAVLPGGAALALHLALTGALALWALGRLWAMQDRAGEAEAAAAAEGRARILALAWLVLTLLNPRMKDYDIGPALLLLAPFLWPVSGRFRVGTSLGGLVLLWPPMLIVIGAALLGYRL